MLPTTQTQPEVLPAEHLPRRPVHAARRGDIQAARAPLPLLAVGLFVAVLGITPSMEAKADDNVKLPPIIAHRGASYAAPENTLAAFKLAWDEQADGIEGDFYLSADGRIICIHDRTTKRTAGEELTVPEATWEQLQQLDVGKWKAPQYAGERVPALPQVLATVGPGKKIYIEIKCGAEVVPTLVETIKASKLLPEQITVISFQKEVIAQIKQQLPDITANWLTGFKQQEDGSWLPAPATIVETLRELKADGVGVGAQRGALTPELATALKEAGFGFHVWTVDDPELAAYLVKLGVDSITTNRPGGLRKELSE